MTEEEATYILDDFGGSFNEKKEIELPLSGREDYFDGQWNEITAALNSLINEHGYTWSGWSAHLCVK